MQFLNLAMLIGLAAAAIPLAIHLLSRRKFRVIEWGAMQFLRGAHRSRARNLRLDEWLLFALRTALLILLVLALARPLLTNPHFQPALTASGQDVAIVLDASSSMLRRADAGAPWDEARFFARRVLDRLGPQDAVSLLLAGGQCRVLPPGLTRDHAAIATALDKLPHADRLEPRGPLEPDRALDAAQVLLEKNGQNPHRRIFLITDGQKADWPANAQRAEQLLGNADRKVPVHVLLTGKRFRSSNLALAQPRMERFAAGTRRAVRLKIDVTNTGQTDTPPAKVRLDVKGQTGHTAEVPGLKPGETTTISFLHLFNHPGTPVARFELTDLPEGADPLAADNTAFLTVNVIDSLNVLVIDGTLGADRFAGSARYLASALRPAWAARETSAATAGLSELNVKVVSPLDAAGIEPGNYAVVILANVARLPDGLANKLVGFVDAGGGVWIAPGDRADPKYYAARLLGPATEVLMPAALEAVEKTTGKNVRRIDPKGLKDTETQTDLTEAMIHQWWRLRIPQGGRSRVSVRLDTGAPLLVERKSGRGTVLLSAIPFDNQWSDLPRKAGFVPLAHRLIYRLAAEMFIRRNFAFGEGIAFPIPPDTKKAELHLPDGTSRKMLAQPGDAGGYLHTGGLMGLFRVRFDGKESPFVIAWPRSESDLTGLPDKTCTAISRASGIVFHRRSDVFLAAVRSDRPGREIWPILALGVLLFLLLELILSRRIARRQSTTAAVSFG